MLIDNWNDFIKETYDSRKKRNPQFSIRSYAKWLGISPAQASQLISGKRNLTRTMALKISDKLSLSPQEKIELLESIDTDIAAQKSSLRKSYEKLKIEEDEFNLIADWPHYSILSLSETKDAKSDPRWIAKRLGIDVSTAREAFDRLERLGFVNKTKTGFIQAKPALTTSKDIQSKAIQRHHKQNLDLAQHKLEQTPTNKREFTSITMAIDPKKIKEAKIMMNEFKRKLCEHLESKDSSEVYTLSMQLFPNTEIKTEK